MAPQQERHTKLGDKPGNQTPNTPNVKESEQQQGGKSSRTHEERQHAHGKGKGEGGGKR